MGDIEAQNHKIWKSTGTLGSINEDSNYQRDLNTTKRNLKYLNSVANTEFSDSDNESKTKNEDNHEKQIQFQNSSKANIILMKESNDYNNPKTTFLNRIANIGNKETSNLSAMLADDEYSPIKLVNPNSEAYKTNEIADFVGHKGLENFKKIRYTIADLVKLEPVNLYQFVESTEDDGDLLITDVIFGQTTPSQNSEISQLEIEFTKMRLDLISPLLDSASKQIELIRFIVSSVDLQKHNNPRVFLSSYGILVDQLIEFYLIPRTMDQISVFILNALIEVLIKYCLKCWKFETLKHEYMDRQFKEWKLQPFVPSKVKVYKYMVALLLTGYKTNLLGEVLVFFNTSPTPHLLHCILAEAETSNKLPGATKGLIQCLRRQLMAEHLKCCEDSNKEKYWGLSSTSVPSTYLSESDQPMKVPNSEIIIDEKREIQEKSSPHKSITDSECDRFPGSLSDYLKF